MPAADFQTTTEIVRAAQALLAPPVWEYVTGGSETETTMLRNREAIAAQAFRARVLRNVATLDLSTDLLGTRLRIPYIFAPVGGLQLITPDGSAAAVRAAAAFGSLNVVSSASEPSLEACAAATVGDAWYQLYVRGDLDWVRAIVDRVHTAAYKALVITVDLAYYGNRERQTLRRWLPLSRRAPVGEEYLALLDWDTIARIREHCTVPLVLKGIQTGEDARIALEHGIDAIWVSNHGGRQLDHGRGTLDMLVEVVGSIGKAVPLIVDGGFLRGTDVLKAIALGATAVASGRLYTLALAADGEAGAVRMLELMEVEMRKALGLLGVTNLAQLNDDYVTRVGVPPGDLAAFPLLPGTF
jgi:isopentenyl diphosphate isomerase/L-lactate dehydrogenase-like FMN-dependent dehydrogenase